MKKSMGMSGIPQPLGWGKVKAIQDKILVIDQQSDRILELLIEKEKEFSESKHRTFLKRSIEGLLNELPYNYIRNSNALYAELVPLLTNIFRAGWISGANKVISETNKIIVEQRIKGNIKTNKEFEKEFEQEKRKYEEKSCDLYMEQFRVWRDEKQVLEEKLNKQNTEQEKIESSLIKIFNKSKKDNGKLNFSEASRQAKKEFPNGLDGRKCDEKYMLKIYRVLKSKGVLK